MKVDTAKGVQLFSLLRYFTTGGWHEYYQLDYPLS